MDVFQEAAVEKLGEDVEVFAGFVNICFGEFCVYSVYQGFFRSLLNVRDSGKVLSWGNQRDNIVIWKKHNFKIEGRNLT